MRLVVVESPYAGDVVRNTRYLRACLRDCLDRGEAPFASHAIYTLPGVLDDLIPEQRERGIAAGFAWRAHAAVVCFYTDLGWSPGMVAAQLTAQRDGLTCEVRRLGADWGCTP
jgi:hypothetical protein